MDFKNINFKNKYLKYKKKTLIISTFIVNIKIYIDKIIYNYNVKR